MTGHDYPPIPADLAQRIEDLDVRQVVDAAHGAMATVAGLHAAYESVHELRSAAGKRVSARCIEALGWVGDDLERLADVIDDISQGGHR